MHREHLVIGLGREEAPVGTDELGADEQRLHPAGGEEGQRGEEVHDPDALVIGGGQPPQHSRALRPQTVQLIDIAPGTR